MTAHRSSQIVSRTINSSGRVQQDLKRKATPTFEKKEGVQRKKDQHNFRIEKYEKMERRKCVDLESCSWNKRREKKTYKKSDTEAEAGKNLLSDTGNQTHDCNLFWQGLYPCAAAIAI